MSFGDQVKKKEKAKLQATAHISFHMTGDGITDCDFYGGLEEWAKDFGFVITNGNVNIYYTSRKDNVDKSKG